MPGLARDAHEAAIGGVVAEALRAAGMTPDQLGAGAAAAQRPAFKLVVTSLAPAAPGRRWPLQLQKQRPR